MSGPIHLPYNLRAACLDTTVPFRSRIRITLFLPVSEWKEGHFHGGNDRRNGTVPLLPNRP